MQCGMVSLAGELTNVCVFEDVMCGLVGSMRSLQHGLWDETHLVALELPELFREKKSELCAISFPDHVTRFSVCHLSCFYVFGFPM